MSGEEYEVEAIINDKGGKNSKRFLVKWAGYASSENTWETMETLAHAQEAVNAYLMSKSKKSSSKKASVKTSSLQESSSDDALFIDVEPKKKAVGESSSFKNTSRNHPAAPGTKTKKRKLEPPDQSKTQKQGKGDDAVAGEDGFVRKVLHMLIDGVHEDIDVVVDESYPLTDIDWEKNVKNVMGLFSYLDDDGNMTAVLEWKNGDFSMHKTKELHRKCPLKLLDFYEKHITFCEKHEKHSSSSPLAEFTISAYRPFVDELEASPYRRI